MKHPINPTFRHWLRLIDELPGKLTSVEALTSVTDPLEDGEGHLHATPTSVVCLEGVVRISSPAQVIDLLPHQALIISAGTWHRHEPLRANSVWFGQGFFPTQSDILIGDRDHEWRGSLPIHPSCKLMNDALRSSSGPERRERFRDLLHQVLRESIEDLSFENPVVKVMIDRLWSGLHRGVTVEDLIRVSGLSRAHAYRLFTDGYGVTPKQAIQTARLWLADGLLQHGLSVQQVAKRSGFPNAVTFSRAYKRTRGHSPSRAKAES